MSAIFVPLMLVGQGWTGPSILWPPAPSPTVGSSQTSLSSPGEAAEPAEGEEKGSPKAL